MSEEFLSAVNPQSRRPTVALACEDDGNCFERFDGDIESLPEVSTSETYLA